MTDQNLPTVVTSILDRALKMEDKPALIFEGETLTFGSFREAVLDGSAWLQTSGVSRGSKVAVLSANHPLAVVATLAIMHAGATWLPVNPRDTVQDIAELMARIGHDGCLFGASVRRQAEELQTARPGRLFAPLEALQVPRKADPTNMSRPDDEAAIFGTGGTTGRAKGVLFLHRNLSTLVSLSLPEQVSDEVVLAAAPLTHVAGRQCLVTLAGGGTTVVLPAFDAHRVLQAIEAHRVTRMTTTPTMLYRLLNEPDVRKYDYSSLRTMGYGAAPIALDRLKEAIDVFGPVMTGGYGQTESPMLISRLLPHEHIVDGRLAPDNRLRSVGKPTAASEVKILGFDGEPLGPGEIGEIVVRGAYQMHAYYGDDEATSAARTDDGFLRTGDLGFLDEDGYLTISGRIKDMIITGGFNVYSAEVENAIASHPAVYESAVFGLPDATWGESVTAAVQLRDGTSLDAAGLLVFLRDRLGGVKTPKRIEFVDQLPRNHNGKVLKRVLREQFGADNLKRSASPDGPSATDTNT